MKNYWIMSYFTGSSCTSDPVFSSCLSLSLILIISLLVLSIKSLISVWTWSQLPLDITKDSLADILMNSRPGLTANKFITAQFANFTVKRRIFAIKLTLNHLLRRVNPPYARTTLHFNGLPPQQNSLS